jgi:hypothetical protein
MCNKEQLIAYLYDDLSASERAAFEGHVAACAGCRQELGELRRTRQHLALWAPPEPEFNFQVVQSARVTAPPRRWFAAVPRWGLAAAATVLLAAGAAAIANVEVRYDANGFVVRTGWSSAVPATGPAGPGAAAPSAAAGARLPAVSDQASSEQLKAAVVALAARVQEMERVQGAQSARLAAASRPGLSVAELRQILADSESRQRDEIAVRFRQLWSDLNATRASDFVRVQQTMAPELQRQRSLIENAIYRTGTQK